ncbi:siderophore ABC transporter substrate-binding protein [Comamonas sp. Y33R10-2]|uniref:siderophore ABC transporter substrate-binding protein n=1 Tax=Comamonas sp. Y33R10-2 TaxID=2853257 RepID=UPI001C5CBD7D|nr:siderophore ABC transporter substrate-binding protein [Comamonas sp. Y33R10-2]QXZ09189.1 siderophore ABC transporter substrate-binding protein [Comamonas sp. Y33R10-2]
MNFSNSRRRTLGLALALLAASGMSAAQAAAPTTITVQHAKGETTVPLAPKRVVVYDLASLDTMQALSLPVAGVPKANFPAYMAGYANAKYKVVGSLFEPDYEALSELRPDLIVVAGRSASKYETLSKIAPTLDLSTSGNNLLGDMQRNVSTLASLWGKQAQGEKLMQQVRSDVDATRAVAAKAEQGLLVLAVNKNMSAQTPGSRFGLLYDVLGVKPALPADPAKTRGISLKMDDIAKLNPEWLFVIDRNAGTGTTKDKDGNPVLPSKELFDNDTIKQTQAGKKQQVVFVDPQIWYLMGSSGPLSMRANAQQIRTALSQSAR